MKRTGKKSKTPPEQALAEHLKLLQIDSQSEYVAWCRKHGFSEYLFKHRKERDREYEFFRSMIAQASRPVPQVRSKNLWQTVKSICDGSVQDLNLVPPHVRHFANLLNTAQDALPTNERIDRQAMLELLECLDSERCKYLFESIGACSRFVLSPENSFLAGLGFLSAYRQYWLRPPSAWRPASHNPRKQFSSLFQHLFDRHGEVPGCFQTVWFQGSAQGVDRYRRWAVTIGSGAGLRGCDLPIAYTRSLWKALRQAPENLTVNEALRWSQVISLGGSARLAEAIIRTRLIGSFEHEDFWSEVIRWFVANPMLDTVHVGPIIDYLHQQRFVPTLREVHGSVATLKPLQPNLTMKGRSVQSLLTHVRGWHASLSYANLDPARSWKSMGLQTFIWQEGDKEKSNWRIWTIRELLSQADLNAEGKKLRHCVSSYSGSCMRGECAIWTMELQSEGGLEKLITIEVHPKFKQIVQARGRWNRYPTEAELLVIRRWANLVGLKVAV